MPFIVYAKYNSCPLPKTCSTSSLSDHHLPNGSLPKLGHQPWFLPSFIPYIQFRNRSCLFYFQNSSTSHFCHCDPRASPITGRPHFTVLGSTDTGLHRHCSCYKWKVCGNPVSNKSIGAIFPIAFAHFGSLCRILVILVIFQTCSLYSLWWSVISDLWCYYCNYFGVPRTRPSNSELNW